MHHFYHHIPPLLPHLQSWIESWLTTGGPVVVFLVTFFEGIPMLGFLAPSHTVVLFAAFLAKIGALRFDSVAFSALGGTIAGDVLGYWLGRRYGYGFLVRFGKMFSVRRQSVEKIKALVVGNLGKAIFIGKFNPVTRSLAPFAVGASPVPFFKFIGLDILANVLWTALALTIGYAFGASYGVAAGYFGKILVVGIIVIVFVAIAYRFTNRQFHIFARYELFSLVANLIGLYGFAAMLQGISGEHHFMLAPDVATNVWFANLVRGTPWLPVLAAFISDVFAPVALALAAVGMPVYFFIKKRWRYLFIALSSLGGGYVVLESLKDAIQSPRPPDALVSLGDFSFPSGHATAAGMILVLVVYFFAPLIKNRPRRWLFIAASLVLALAVGASRLVLGVHWLSDVVAGYSLGILWATGMILLVRYGGLVWRNLAGFAKSRETVE